MTTITYGIYSDTCTFIIIIIIIIIIYSYSKSLGQWHSYLQVLIKAITKYTDQSIKTSFPLH